MTGKHTGPIDRPRPYGPVDPHGYIFGYAIFLGIIIAGTALILLIIRTGATP